jgi:hypothetical protein
MMVVTSSALIAILDNEPGAAIRMTFPFREGE